MFTTLFKRSLENPKTPISDPDEWLVEMLSGGDTASGMRVNAETALRYSPVFKGVNLISRDVAKLPLFVYRRVGEGKERDQSHPAYQLLRRKANREMTAFHWMVTLQAHAILHGHGYSVIVRDASRRPVELVPVAPWETKAIELGSGSDVRLAFETKIRGEAVVIDFDDMVHIKSVLGMGLIDKARESIGLGSSAQRYASTFYKNGAKFSGVAETDATLTDTARKRIREGLSKLYTGTDNMHKLAILEEGLKLKPWSMSNESAQFLETRQFEIREMANFLCAPPHKLGDTTRTSFASLEQENQAYLDETVDPWLVTWETELWLKLLSTREQRNESHIIEFVRQALVRADISSRYNAYNTAILGGWMSRDEARSRENLNPIPDGEGEKFFVPLNLGIAGEDPPDSSNQGTPRDDSGDTNVNASRDAQRAIIVDVAERMVKRLCGQAQRRAKDPMAFVEWIDNGTENNDRTIEDALTPASQLWNFSAPVAAAALVEQFKRALAETAQATERNLGVVVKSQTEKVQKTLPSDFATDLMERIDGNGA